MPFTVTLSRWPREASPEHFTIGRWIPPNLEEDRRARLRTAIERKAAKLEAARSDRRATMLILEDTDIALSNPFVIQDALEAVLSETKHPIPDHIFLVRTFADSFSVLSLH